MASVITYVLVSNPDAPDDVHDHPMIEEHELELEKTFEAPDGGKNALRFVVDRGLEEATDLREPCRQLSAAFSEATVLCCDIEERFNQVEHLRTVVFIDGEHAGELEHGYVLNVGSD